MEQKVFIRKTSVFLPNFPINNDDMENYLGLIGNKKSRVKNIVLRQNGIKTRYYALDCAQKPTHTNAELAKNAINGLFDENFTEDNVNLLSCATSNADQFIPSHASMVHGLLKRAPMELFSSSGVCLTVLQALKIAFMAIKSNENTNAICCASELPSIGLLSKNYDSEYEYTTTVGVDPYMAFEKDFLRFMLSDGAGAVLLDNVPNESSLSLQIDWILMDSYANELPTCMFAGAELRSDGELKGWKEFTDDEIKHRAVLTIKQDIRLLKEHIISYWIKHIQHCLKKYEIDANKITFVIPHVSSMFFYGKLNEGLKEAGIPLTDEKWFTNLKSVGNIGSAAILVALDELFHSGKLQKGNTILLLVPESGRFSYGTVHLTVV